LLVIPAEAGIQLLVLTAESWIPASAGMTSQKKWPSIDEDF
jgi:hypothetical protein